MLILEITILNLKITINSKFFENIYILVPQAVALVERERERERSKYCMYRGREQEREMERKKKRGCA